MTVRRDLVDDRHGGVGGDRGSGLVVGLVFVFAFTFLGLVWLTRDVDRGISNRSTAQSIAFQAARAGSQATSIADVRSGTDVVVIDEPAARERAASTASELFASYGVSGRISTIAVAPDAVTVIVEITDGSISVTGAGTVRAVRAP